MLAEGPDSLSRGHTHSCLETIVRAHTEAMFIYGTGLDFYGSPTLSYGLNRRLGSHRRLSPRRHLKVVTGVQSMSPATWATGS